MTAGRPVIIAGNWKMNTTPLDASLLARNAGALERAAHSLKSSVGNFGAKHAMQLAQAIEFAGKNGELNEASEKVSELHDEMRRVMAALQEML